MMQPSPPESTEPETDREVVPGSAAFPGQLSILELIDECAAAMGLGGWEYTTAVNPRRRLDDLTEGLG
jgi:hypothetical protein